MGESPYVSTLSPRSSCRRFHHLIRPGDLLVPATTVRDLPLGRGFGAGVGARPASGQLVIWDNLGVHKSAETARCIVERGCRVLFLSPYSPDFAPIAQAFRKLKAAVRLRGARTREALEDAIAAGLTTITAADAQAWFAHCGYPVPAQRL